MELFIAKLCTLKELITATYGNLDQGFDIKKLNIKIEALPPLLPRGDYKTVFEWEFENRTKYASFAVIVTLYSSNTDSFGK
ncbi:CLUMA_CG016700, isoform A [Clunio marinus]|uniref:CLUMA_CG016700, isoform A n=1 Tax=Clunio marinus TaxID=568069 RepID=A0A1J1ITR7_9DIPT|nr:CLUMA_CG016700, isoform A [Clunio marinus]